MKSTITIVCGSCGLKVDTPRCETDPPNAAEMHGIVCGDCDTGGFDMPEFFDAKGNPVSGDPETFSKSEATS